MQLSLFNSRREKINPVELIKDSICGMEVDPANAIRTELGGTTYYFCRAGCKASFKKAHVKNGYRTSIRVRRASRKQSGCCG